MPIKSAKVVAEKLPAMIQKAFRDYADCKVGINRDKKRDIIGMNFYDWTSDFTVCGVCAPFQTDVHLSLIHI